MLKLPSLHLYTLHSSILFHINMYLSWINEKERKVSWHLEIGQIAQSQEVWSVFLIHSLKEKQLLSLHCS